MAGQSFPEGRLAVSHYGEIPVVEVDDMRHRVIYW